MGVGWAIGDMLIRMGNQYYKIFFLMPIKDCSVVFHDGKHRSLRLGSSIACDPVNSYSSLLAISHYLAHEVPHVLPPLSSYAKGQISLYKTEAFTPIVNVWNECLLQCVIAHGAFRKDDHFFISVKIPSDSFQVLLESSAVHDGQEIVKEFQSERERLEHIFNLEITDPQKNVAVFHTHPVSEELQYAPIINACANLVGNLFNNQKWTIFDIPKGSVPSVEEIIALNAILITGSEDSVLNKSEYIQNTIDNLGKGLKLAPKLKVVGICYGHQLVLQHFGGQVVKKQLIGGLQTIQLKGEMIKKYPILRPLEGLQTVLASQCHSDFVQTVPQNFDLLAWSEHCKVQSAISTDGRIFTTQFHWQVLYKSMQRFYTQAQDNMRDSFPYELEQPHERIVLNHQDSALYIDLVTEFFS